MLGLANQNEKIQIVCNELRRDPEFRSRMLLTLSNIQKDRQYNKLLANS